MKHEGSGEPQSMSLEPSVLRKVKASIGRYVGKNSRD